MRFNIFSYFFMAGLASTMLLWVLFTLMVPDTNTLGLFMASVSYAVIIGLIGSAVLRNPLKTTKSPALRTLMTLSAVAIQFALAWQMEPFVRQIIA